MRGLVYTHNRANANTAQVHQVCATVQAIVDLLVAGGVLDLGALDAKRKETGEDLRRQYLAQGMAVAMQEFTESKYAFRRGAEVDCQARVQLCQAACCRLPLALSKEDVREGIVRWELGQPYMIAHDSDGYCAHFDRETHCCTIYAHRPVPCRGYDCREDERIWLDFDKGVINPQIWEPDWPARLELENTSAP